MSLPKPDIRAILFDKDGTLVDFERTWGTCILRATDHAAGGDRQLAERLRALGGYDARTGRTQADSLFAACNTAEIVDAFAAAGVTRDPATLVGELDDIFREASENAVGLVDTPRLFERLRAAGLRLGIASSDNAASIAVTARTLGIADDLAFIAGYDSGYGAKPGPGMFTAFCEAIGEDPRNVAMVGDNRHDMEMGCRAGAGLRIAVLSGTGTRERLAPIADVCLPDIAALPDYLHLDGR
ncbi:HAD family hydrolase [Pararhizobium mangrovi]|nr:HAD family hydrolase [Pararhizobium mangrovi]